MIFNKNKFSYTVSYLTMKNRYRKAVLFCMLAIIGNATFAQTPKTFTSSETLQQLKKLDVLGSVLYIAAHPDDENTRLLGYLANEKLYRTGYMSLTRGDGGQNLIGDEQGIDLGLIRTQELLSARRIDGAEQFFSRAYDFGFCKSSEEAMKIWGHDKILSDIVWVVRKFRPDVIITRFPEDERAGHGHHSASAILAREAFTAAADLNQFPEQLKQGVTVWQAKRILWNTFNFGSTNTQSDTQFKLDVGMYNPLLGKSYGEIAATGRSQHKSQGFGVAAQRGSAVEYFYTTKGSTPVNDLMDGVDVTWNRIGNKNNEHALADSIIKNYSFEHPENSIAQLVRLYSKVDKETDAYWKEQKQNDIKKVLINCSGLFLEATAASQYAVQGDSLQITTTINNRLGISVQDASINMYDTYHGYQPLPKNINVNYSLPVFIRPDQKATQPYWLQSKMDKGSFNVTDQQQIGMAENEPLSIVFGIKINGVSFRFKEPVRYKYTDPVKGELYQPVLLVYPLFVSSTPSILIFKNDEANTKRDIHFSLQANTAINSVVKFNCFSNNKSFVVFDSMLHLAKGEKKNIDFTVSSNFVQPNAKDTFSAKLSSKAFNQDLSFSMRKISYAHIPDINYNFIAQLPVLKIDLKIAGSSVGYIVGAGDKVPQALEQMGYKVTILNQADVTATNLQQFDAIITGVRAYNINEWLNGSYEVLMQYVKDGGVLLAQYNTNNNIGPVKAKISPYPFNISRNRITDEEAKVTFLLPEHPALNYPNKITAKDFDGWIQERSIYDAENIDGNYQRILSMKDPNENEQDGSLIITNYGKGRFVYTGLVFFRELPAAVPGAYRLLANLIAKSFN